MSLFDCIESGIAGGEIDGDRGREAQSLFNRLVERYEPTAGADGARAQAAEDVKRIMAERTQAKRRRTLLQIQTARRLTAELGAHRTIGGVADMSDALPSLLAGRDHSAITSVQSVRSTLRGFYHQKMTDVLQTFGRDLLGRTRNKAGLRNFARELHGEKTGDSAAAELAEAATAAMRDARRDFNAAGGDIGDLADWGLPHSHDGDRVEAAGFEAWAAEIRGGLDWGRMIDHETGQPFAIAGGRPPPGRADEFLRDRFEQITTDGWATRQPSFMRRGLSTGNTRQESRVLHFKSADDWLAYNETFGRGDPFQAMMAHLDGMARDTAQMRVLGPNPHAGLEYAIQLAEKRAQTDPWGSSRKKAVDQVRRRAHLSRNMLALVGGAANRPVNGLMAEFLAGTRQVLVSAQLGSAFLSAISDVGFQYAAAREIGMDPGGIIARQMKMMVSENDRMAALRTGVIADRLANTGSTAARYLGEQWSPEITERLSDFVMRASALARWTETGRHAFQLEFMGYLADHAERAFDQLPAPLQGLLGRRGFSAEDWDAIRSTPLHVDDSGATFLVPAQMRDRQDLAPEVADGLAIRLMSVIHEQTEFAVPSASLEGQATMLDRTMPGTWMGELLRSGVMYKSFGLSVLYSQTRRMLMREGTFNRIKYAGSMMALLTLMGAVSVQMKDISKGRDPRPMDRPEFLAAAVLQGGGFGIFGDFFAAAENRFGGGVAETLVGPAIGFADDTLKLGISGAKAAAGGDANVGREAVNWLRRYTPGASLWYMSLAAQRWGFDQLQEIVDPEAQRAFRRAERRRIRDYGNASWWQQGELAPDRAPQITP